MRIDELTLKNFRCFEEQAFKFHPQFNCITGKNASGKTTILDAISLTMREWVKEYLSPSPTVDSNSKWDFLEEKDVRLVYNADTYKYQHPGRVTTKGDLLELYFHYSKASGVDAIWQNMEFHVPEQRGKRIYRIKNIVSNYFAKSSDKKIPCIAYYKTTRLYEPPTLEGEPSIDILTSKDLVQNEGYTDCFDAVINLRRLRSWIVWQAQIEFEEGKETLISQIVRESMASMLENAIDIRYVSRHADIVVTFEDNSKKTFQQLSDGQRNLLALAGDIAMRMARLNPYLGKNVLQETPGVVLIDELDLHLHPEWQRSVVDNLKKTFPKVQFFVTTHSPFIIQSLGKWEHIPLEGQPVENPQRYSIEEIAEGLMGVDHPQVGKRYVEMLDNAKDYLALLDEAALSPEEKQEEYKRLLRERLIPYPDNPAYQAFLEAEMLGRIGP
jgi:predicted ATP-binding protein involved in virulence